MTARNRGRLKIFLGYAAGSAWLGPGALFALSAVPYAVVALVMWRNR